MFKDFDRLTSDGRSYRLSLYEESLNFVWNYCKVNGVHNWIDAGDMFHSRESISLPVLDMVGKIFNGFEKSELCSGKISKYFLKGNHDIYNKVGNITSLNILSQYGTVITKNCTLNLNIQGANSLIKFIPWSEKQDFVEQVNKDNSNLVISHRMLQGAKHNGIVLDGESLESLDVSKFDYAFIGHVHEYQKVKDNIYYIGSLVSNNFNDKSQEKGFIVYDFNQKSFERVINPFSPKYIVKKIKSLEEYNNFINNLKQDDSEFYDIRFELKEGEKIPEFEQTNNIRISISKTDSVENRLENANLLTPQLLLEKYKEMNSLEEETYKIGKEILSEILK
jgi:hypothetical protein